jgi:hypothetical protein
MTTENAKVGLAAILTTIAEVEPMPAPQSHLYLGLQTAGVVSVNGGGEALDDWTTLLRIGRDLNWWTNTAETVTLTDVGREKAREIEQALAA